VCSPWRPLHQAEWRSRLVAVVRIFHWQEPDLGMPASTLSMTSSTRALLPPRCCRPSPSLSDSPGEPW
jgi:hypothetical protein